MRALVVMCLVVGACGNRTEAEGEPSGSAGSSALADLSAKEQARFDSERRPDKIIDAMEIKPGDRVADIGAGSGLLTVHIARAVAPNGRVVATDIDSASLDLLAQRIKAAGFSEVVERRVVAADATGLEDGSYDAILLAEVDHFFTDPAAWLKSASQALKPGGRIVISNRIYHRAQSMAAARKAGLVLKNEWNPVATHFIAVFVIGESKK